VTDVLAPSAGPTLRRPRGLLAMAQAGGTFYGDGATPSAKSA
jgi:hypothetical protein